MCLDFCPHVSFVVVLLVYLIRTMMLSLLPEYFEKRVSPAITQGLALYAIRDHALVIKVIGALSS